MVNLQSCATQCPTLSGAMTTVCFGFDTKDDIILKLVWDSVIVERRRSRCQSHHQMQLTKCFGSRFSHAVMFFFSFILQQSLIIICV